MANILRVEFDSQEEWPIKTVTVYEDRAQVGRVLDYKVTDYGEVELKLANLPKIVLPESVRAEVETGNATIFEVAPNKKTTRPDKVENTERQTEIQKLTKELTEESERLTKRHEWLEGYSTKLVPSGIITIEKGKSVFEKVIGDSNLKGFSDTLDMYESEIEKIEERLIDISAEKLKLSKESANIIKERNKLQQMETKVTTEATVLLNIIEEKAQIGDVITLKLFYVLKKAKWRASYDVRVDKAKNDIAITYYGKISNDTGEDWSEVSLSLSTAKPSRGGVLPPLPRALAMYRGQANELRARDNKASPPRRNRRNIGRRLGRANHQQQELLMDQMNDVASIYDEELEEDDFEEDKELMEELAQIVEAEQTQTEEIGGSALFRLDRLCSIESDGKPRKQKIGNIKLAASFTYVFSPKVTASCFIKCTSKNESPFVLVKGPMAVFFNESFVTMSKMKLVLQNQSFSVYLGVEETVKLDYKPEVSKDEKTRGGILASRQNLRTVSRKINIVNTRSEDISCLVYEQVPLAKNERIKVEVTSPVLQKKGRETYKLNKLNHLEAKNIIKKSSTWTIQFDYKIEWPIKEDISYTESMENQAPR